MLAALARAATAPCRRVRRLCTVSFYETALEPVESPRLASACRARRAEAEQALLRLSRLPVRHAHREMALAVNPLGKPHHPAVEQREHAADE